MKNYKFLNNINFPSDLRKLPEDDLQKVSDEVREEMISAVSETGGHLGAGLGVVELTVALHYVFDTPNDKLIWDVGHQSYPHKKLIRIVASISMLFVASFFGGLFKQIQLWLPTQTPTGIRILSSWMVALIAIQLAMHVMTP